MSGSTSRRPLGPWGEGVRRGPLVAVWGFVVLLVLGVGAAPAEAAAGDWRGHTISDGSPSFVPTVDDGFIAYTSFAGPSPVLKVFDCADGGTEEVAPLGYPPSDFVLDDGRVVWLQPVGGVAQVFVHDLVTGATTQLSQGAQTAHDVDLDGPLVVWRAGESTDAEVYLHDLASGVTTRLTDNAHFDGEPSVGDGLVVWEARPAGLNSEIFLFDATQGRISQLTVNTFPDTSPQTSCGYVVWQGAETGAVRDLFAWDNLQHEMWAVTRYASDDWVAAIVGRRMLWFMGRSSTFTDILHYDLGDREMEGLGGLGHASGVAALDLGITAWREGEVGELSIVFWDSARRSGRYADALDLRGTHPSVDGGLLAWERGSSASPDVYLLGRESFADVPWWHLHGSAVGELARREVVSGFGGGVFGPDEPLWRQHFAKMIVLALQLTVTEADVCLFSDVEIGGPTTLYPDNYVAVAAARGLTLGTGGTRFSPYAEISRAQVVTMLVRAIEAHEPGRLRLPPSGWRGTWGDFSPTHAENARIAEYNHLLDGLRMRGVDPWGSMTRGECAQMLYNMVCYLGIAVLSGG